jgi:hypothetical protein
VGLLSGGVLGIMLKGGKKIKTELVIGVVKALFKTWPSAAADFYAT